MRIDLACNFFFLIQPVFAVTYYVPDDYPTIQAAVDAAYLGDRIIVRSGTYTGEGNKNITIDTTFITIESESGPENTIIDCEGEGRGFSFNNVDEYTSLTGFKIINGSSDSGGAILLDNASPSITNCVISGNTTSGGGGGIGMEGSSPSITNCVITGNEAGYGGGVYSWNGHPIITNCTIIGNVATYGGGIYNTSYFSLTNTIVYFNYPDQLWGGAFTVLYSDIMGGFEGEGNIDEDPQFVGGGDLHLTEGSPCIDTGTADGAPDYDIDGNPRPHGAGYDMGAYEYSSHPPPPDPLPDIKANGSDAPLFVTPSESVDISISLDPGDKAGELADWWIGIMSPYGTFPIIARPLPLFELAETSLFEIPLPVGLWVFYFILDDNPNGIFDRLTWYDYVVVAVSSEGLEFKTEALPDFEAFFQEKIRKLMKE